MSQKTVAELEAELEEAKKREADAAKTKEDDKAPPATGEKTSKSDDEDLGENGKKALEAEREARRKAEKDAKDAKAELDRINNERTEAERKAAEEQGNYKKLYEDLLAEHNKTKDDLVKKERDALRSKVAAEHNLPTDLAERLAGETEADLKADAEKLAKLVKAPAPANTETGNGTKPPKQEPTKRDPKSYVFVPQGAVNIPD